MRELRALLWILALLVSSTHAQNGYVQPPTLVTVNYLGNVVSYSGNMTIKSSSDSAEAKTILFHISMVQNRHISCRNLFCYYGWMEDYTVTGQNTVLGYPNGNNDIDQVFAFDTNNQNDFVITRHTNSSQMFGTLVDLFCRQANPGILKNNAFTTNGSDLTAVTAQRASPLTLQGLSTKDTSTRTNDLTYNSQQGMMQQHTDSSNVHLTQSTLKDDKNNTVGFQKNCNMNIKRLNEGVPNQTLANMVRQAIQTMRILQGPACAWNKWRIDHAYQKKAVRDVSSDPNITLKNSTSNNTGRYADNMTVSSSPLPTISASLPPAPGFKSLLNMDKQIYSKDTLGKGINLFTTISVDANSGQNQVRMGILLRYQVLGPIKQLVVFNSTVNPGLTIKIGHDFGGEWGFTFIIPLIPPLMGLSINLGIYLQFFFQIFAYLGCSYEPNTKHVIVSGGGGVSTGFAVQATASLQVLVIELGVFITGTLVNLTVSVNTKTILMKESNSYTLDVTIVLELRFFQFTWGFFLRIWFLFWGLRIILVSWPIYNGISMKWLLFKKSFAGALT